MSMDAGIERNKHWFEKLVEEIYNGKLSALWQNAFFNIVIFHEVKPIILKGFGAGQMVQWFKSA